MSYQPKNCPNVILSINNNVTQSTGMNPLYPMNKVRTFCEPITYIPAHRQKRKQTTTHTHNQPSQRHHHHKNNKPIRYHNKKTYRHHYHNTSAPSTLPTTTVNTTTHYRFESPDQDQFTTGLKYVGTNLDTTGSLTPNNNYVVQSPTSIHQHHQDQQHDDDEDEEQQQQQEFQDQLHINLSRSSSEGYTTVSAIKLKHLDDTTASKYLIDNPNTLRTTKACC